MYSSAICFIPEIWRKQEGGQRETEQEPFIETLHDTNIDINRATITTFSQSKPSEETSSLQALSLDLQETSPLQALSSDLQEETCLLQALPLDPQEETCLLQTLPLEPQNERFRDETTTCILMDNEPVQELMNALMYWKSDPDNTALALDLVEEYYSAAHNDTLDKESQKIYLEQVRELLWHLLWRDNQNAALWIKLAQTRCELGSLRDALQDALYALQLQPQMLDYALLAMSLAFRLHAWDTLVELARGEVKREELPASLQPLRWWTTLPVEKT